MMYFRSCPASRCVRDDSRAGDHGDFVRRTCSAPAALNRKMSACTRNIGQLNCYTDNYNFAQIKVKSMKEMMKKTWF